MQLTTREIFYLLKEIGARKKIDSDIREIERSFQASLHGAKYEPNLNNVVEVAETPLTSEQQAAIDAQLKNSLERIQREKQHV